MSETTKNLCNTIGGKEIASAYSEYSDRASKDVNGNSLTLTISENKVTEIGGVPVGGGGGGGDITIHKVSTGVIYDQDNEAILDTNNEPITDSDSVEFVDKINGTDILADRSLNDEDGNNIKNTYIREIFHDNSLKGSGIAGEELGISRGVTQLKISFLSKYSSYLDSEMNNKYYLAYNNVGFAQCIGAFHFVSSFTPYYSAGDGAGSNNWPLLGVIENIDVQQNAQIHLLMATASMSFKPLMLELSKDERKINIYLSGNNRYENEWYNLYGSFIL